MRRLYWGKKVCDVVFILSDDDGMDLEEAAQFYINEQDGCGGFHYPITVKEITVLKQVPQGWKGGTLVWGTQDKEELTAEQFLKQQVTNKKSSEYQEYLRLKKKFE
jgi:hypothetical protein